MPSTDRHGPKGNNPPTLTEILEEKHAAIFQRRNKWLRQAKAADLNPVTQADCDKLKALFVDGRDIANDADSIREREKEEPLKTCKEIDTVFNGGVRDVIGADPKKPGLAQQIAQAAAKRELALLRAAQEVQQKEANRLRLAAEKAEEEAKTKAEAGQTKLADKAENKAEALHDAADTAQMRAQQDVGAASKTSSGGVSSSINVKMTCVGIRRADLDLATVAPFIKEAHLIDAVNAWLELNQGSTLKGAVLEEKVGLRARR